MTLTDFLLARIAEDESAATEWGVKGERARAARLCAETQAKRRLLNEYRARDEDVALMLGPDSRRQRQWAGLHLATKVLAAIYSDHPDYRDEWRP